MVRGACAGVLLGLDVDGLGAPPPSHAALQPLGEPGEQQVHHHVDQRDDQVGLHQQVRVAGEVGRLLHELGVAHHVAERGVLEERDELGDQRRHHVADRLRQDHRAHRDAVGQPERGRGLELAAVHREDARPVDLGQHGHVDQDDRHHQLPQDRQVDAEARQRQQERVDQEQQRDAAEQLDVAGGEPAHRARRGEPAQRQHDAERERDDRGQHGRGDRPDEALTEEPQVRQLREREPTAAAELPAARELVERQRHQPGQQHQRQHGEHPDPRPAARPRLVEEHAGRRGHRAIPSLRSSAPPTVPPSSAITR
jgi:hypothetical protein